MTPTEPTRADSIRLDRWLHASRWYKTRALAAEAVANGRVEVNGARAKAAKAVRAGDAVHIRRPPYTFRLVVLELAARRVSAALARTLYRETEDSIAERESLRRALALEKVVEQRRAGKLHKNDRRQRERLKRTGV